MSNPAAFTGSVPKSYHQYLVPLIFERYAEDITARVLAARPTRVLELACGTGVVTRRLAKGLPTSASLTATDLNEAMLDIASGTIGSGETGQVGGVDGAGRASITFQVVDACTLPFADRSFDAIVCQYGVMFFPDKVKAMREARRVLVPGGQYVFNVWDSLEHNPIPRVANETLASFFPTDPPSFLQRTPYGWFDRAEIERVVRAGGFTHVKIATVEFPSVAPKAEDAARGFLEGTPIWPALLERGVTDPAPIREKITSALAARFGSEPSRSTMRAVVVTAS